ncbi:lachesin-like [Oratosquilla oratoria]|uniref:lachesin-like n=1 Tax=Oratosquilla oratoria TaxID=337810 RepID=UPI003F75D8E3
MAASGGFGGGGPWRRSRRRSGWAALLGAPPTSSTLACCFHLLLCFAYTAAYSLEFAAPVQNVSVPRGRDAKLTCLVRHLGGYRVGWVKVDTKAIQAIHTHVITHNPRIRVAFDDHSTWHLLIKEVTEEDAGAYMCQINTDPMISQLGYLEVQIPPEFVDEESSGDVSVNEGQEVLLNCVAHAHPPAKVHWVREDKKMIRVTSGGITKKVASWEGSELFIDQVSREDMAAYLCIAQNGVPPPKSKRVLLSVHFHPIIHVPNQLIGSPYGKNLTLECNVEAFPKPITFWTYDNDEMIMSSSKFHVTEESSESGGYSLRMTLMVVNFGPKDPGAYTCNAKNSIGEVNSKITVYYIPPPTTTPSRPSPPFVETNRLDDYEVDTHTGRSKDAHNSPVPFNPSSGSSSGKNSKFSDNGFSEGSGGTLPPWERGKDGWSSAGGSSSHGDAGAFYPPTGGGILRSGHGSRNAWDPFDGSEDSSSDSSSSLLPSTRWPCVCLLLLRWPWLAAMASSAYYCYSSYSSSSFSSEGHV